MNTRCGLNAEVIAPGEAIWSYLQLVHEPLRTDFILCLGGNDTGVAQHAAGLWHQGLAPLIIMSGGLSHQDDLARTGWERPEALIFAEVAEKCGVPGDAILREIQARHTGENFTMTAALIAALSLPHPKRLLVVAKPYMTRRGFAAGNKVWPGVELRMHCERIGLGDYLERWPEPDRILNIMVGDLHRIIVYPALGFQIHQDVPEDVFVALKCLVSVGFGQHLVAGHSLREKYLERHGVRLRDRAPCKRNPCTDKRQTRNSMY